MSAPIFIAPPVYSSLDDLPVSTVGLVQTSNGIRWAQRGATGPAVQLGGGASAVVKLNGYVTFEGGGGGPITGIAGGEATNVGGTVTVDGVESPLGAVVTTLNPVLLNDEHGMADFAFVVPGNFAGRRIVTTFGLDHIVDNASFSVWVRETWGQFAFGDYDADNDETAVTGTILQMVGGAAVEWQAFTATLTVV